MDIAAMMLAPHQLWVGEEPWNGPLAVIDLAAADHVPGGIALPPCPVIGIGDPASPLAPLVDAVVEPPVSLEGIARSVLARPHTAAVIVQLLRVLPKLSVEDGLTCESMAYGLLQGSAEHAAWLAARGGEGGEAPHAGDVRLAREDATLCITLDRPQAGNAIDRPMRDALHTAFSFAAIDESIRAVRLLGAGRTFSLGADLSEFGTTGDPATAHHIRGLTLPARAIARCADRLEVHVQGGCVGAGLEMAAFARRITATRDAWFHLPELAMGLLPGAGGCASLTRRIGRQRAGLMILSGKRISARQALGWGLVDALVDDAPADDRGADISG